MLTATAGTAILRLEPEPRHQRRRPGGGVLVGRNDADRGPDVNGALEDVYLVRVPGGTISRVSVTSAGVQPDRGDSILPSLSADGRWLAFASTAPLDEPPRDRDRAASARCGRSTSATRSAAGQRASPAPPNRRSSQRRQLAAVASAPTGGASRLRRTRRTCSTTTATARPMCCSTIATPMPSPGSAARADGSSAGGESTGPVISGDGRFVAFQSDAANLVCARRWAAARRNRERRAATPGAHAEDINLLWDVFLFDSAERRHSSALSEDELGGWMEPSAGPALDATGQVIAFSSRHPVDADRPGRRLRSVRPRRDRAPDQSRARSP